MPRRLAALLLAAALALALCSCAAAPATIYAGVAELPSRQPTDTLLLEVTRAIDAPLDPSVPINLDAAPAQPPPTTYGEYDTLSLTADNPAAEYGTFTLTLATTPNK